MSILWKEWRQQRLLFVLGAGLGILFPFFDMLSRRKFGSYTTHAGSGEVAVLGGLYALILAIATSHDDIRHGVSEFWRSRPVSVARVFLVKVLVGAGLLLITFLVAESLDFLTGDPWGGNGRAAWNILTVTWPVAVLIFSAAMFFTVLMRDSARATMVAIWVLLLIYYLPLLVVGLRAINVFDMFWEGGRGNPSILMDVLVPMLRSYEHASGSVISVPVRVPIVHTTTLSQWLWRIVTMPEYLRYLVLVAIMMAGSTVCLVLSILAVKRNWHWQPGQKTLAWTIGLSAAIIFALAMFQVGQNLLPATTCNGKPIDPILKRASQVNPTYDWAGPPAVKAIQSQYGYGWPGARICTSGEYLYSVDSVNQDPSGQGPRVVQQYDGLLDVYRHPAVGVNGKGAIVSRTRFASTGTLRPGAHQAIEFPVLHAKDGRLFIGYQVSSRTEGGLVPGAKEPQDPLSLHMLVVDVSDPMQPGRIADVELDRSRNQVFQSKGDSVYGHYCYIWGEWQLMVVSLADPEQPRIVRRIPIADLGLDKDNPPAVEQLSVVGDKLLCVGTRVILLLDLADPQTPRPVFRRILTLAELAYPSVIYTALLSDDLLYVGTEAALEIHRLQPAAGGGLQAQLLGRRYMTPLEHLVGRRPHELLLRPGLLYEADERFGLLVYDVSDPTRPRRAYHASSGDNVTSIGIWEDLLYMNGTFGAMTLVAMP
jgi:hypothetical protein